jgi:hypothetical protein
VSNAELAGLDEKERSAENTRRRRLVDQAKRRDDALRRILGDPTSRPYLEELLDHCGIYRSAFRDDVRDEARVLGVQSVGLKIIGDIARAAPDALSGVLVRQAPTTEGETT